MTPKKLCQELSDSIVWMSAFNLRYITEWERYPASEHDKPVDLSKFYAFRFAAIAQHLRDKVHMGMSRKECLAIAELMEKNDAAFKRYMEASFNPDTKCREAEDHLRNFLADSRDREVIG